MANFRYNGYSIMVRFMQLWLHMSGIKFGILCSESSQIWDVADVDLRNRLKALASSYRQTDRWQAERASLCLKEECQGVFMIYPVIVTVV